jgi:Mg-chelatase subunit ChlD
MKTTIDLMSKLVCLFVFSVTALITSIACGQAGVSSLSMGASRAGIQLRFNEIRVEEFVNYHRHDLPLPRDGKMIRLDARWEKLSNGKQVLQVGLATPRAMDRELAQPLNLVLVIDRSGSMSGDRIRKVKRSLRSFIECLRKKDSVTIVSFSNSARVDLSACRKTNQAKIEKAIQAISVGGGTNLHGGLMLGYREAKANFDPEKANRVILLTDGVANVGTTETDQIVRESQRFNNKGIDLSTIGLGHDFNRQLLRELADAGRGTIHFVDDSQDIEKTFVNEVDSLLSPAAKNVKLKIDFGIKKRVGKIYGYEPEIAGSTVGIKLDDLNCGATLVVVSELKRPKKDAIARNPISVELSYVDRVTNQPVVVKKAVVLNEVGGQDESDESWPRKSDVAKNYSIARIANGLSLCAKFSQQRDFIKADKKLAAGTEFARSQYNQGDDEDVDRIMKIAMGYREQVRRAIADDTKSVRVKRDW